MSSKEKYYNMFNKDVFGNLANEHIEWARINLKKEDRIIWFLKEVKYSILLYMSHSLARDSIPKKEVMWAIKSEIKGTGNGMRRLGDESANSLAEAYDMYLKEPRNFLYSPRYSIDPIKEFLRHFLVSMDIPEIKNTVMKNQTWMDLEDKFSEAEKKWEADNLVRSVPEYGDAVLSVPNSNLVVFRLNRASCKLEGDAMSHCGNMATLEDSDIYSVRSPDPENSGHWIPHVTAIENTKGSGEFGEIKGFGNQKPSDRYHPAIIAMIESGIIKKLGGGGYKPENNFSMGDLTDKERDYLYDYSPSVFTASQTWEREGKVLNERVMSAVRSELNTSEDEDKIVVPLLKGAGVSSLGNQLDLLGFNVLQKLMDERNVRFSINIGKNTELLVSAINLILELDNGKERLEPIIEYARDFCGDILDLNNIDLDTAEGIVEISQYTDAERISTILINAISNAETADILINKELEFKYIESHLQKTLPGISLNVDLLTSEWVLNSPIELALSLARKIELASNEDFTLCEVFRPKDHNSFDSKKVSIREIISFSEMPYRESAPINITSDNLAREILLIVDSYDTRNRDNYAHFDINKNAKDSFKDKLFGNKVAERRF